MIVLLIDADNLSSPAWVEEACNSLQASEGRMAVLRAYGSAENLKGLAQPLQDWAIRPYLNLSLSKNTTDVALAVDAMELACQAPKPTVVAIGSGDADFLPLVVRLRERGIRVICVSERGKMSAEAAQAYDAVVLVGKDQPRSPVLGVAAAPAKKTAAKKAAAPKPRVPTMPVKKVTVKVVPKVVAKKAPSVPKKATKPEVTLAQILEAVPALRRGQMQPLSDVVNQLHSTRLIGKNASSTKLFNRFPGRFELTPAKQPNQVRYLAI
jgi:hypothetical protein